MNIKSTILVIGDFILDRYVSGEINRISPESSAPVLEFKDSNYKLGGAANVASNLISLDNEVCFISVIGFDDNSRIANKILKSKIKKSFIIREKIKTTVKTRFHVSGNQILRLDEEEKINLKPGLLKKIKSKLNNLKNISAIYIADYEKGIINKNLIKLINKFSKKKKIPIFVDPKNNKIELFKNIDFLKPNLNYIKKIFNDNNLSLNNLKNKIKFLSSKYKIKNIIVTLGPKGSIAYQAKTKTFIYSKPHPVKVFDLSGAGDVFGSTFLSYYLKNKDLKKALNFANIAASLSVKQIGAVNINESEIEKKAILDHKKNILKFNNDKKEILTNLKISKNKNIGFTNGCFDIIHPGHINFLNECKKKCDYLIVGLNSDSSVRLLKGKNRPIINESYRAYQLISLTSVDLIIIFNEKTPLELIKFIKPNNLFKGSDYKKNQIIGEKFMRLNGQKTTRIQILKKKIFSSSNILSKII